MKVGYRKLNGYKSTAYLDDDYTEDRVVYDGEDKYTGAPLRVQWDDARDEWMEVA